MTVADLLRQSREAHARYRRAAGHIDQLGSIADQPNPDAARLAVVDALEFRNQADALDPSHDDPAWSDDTAANKGVPSATLVHFYRSFFVAIPA